MPRVERATPEVTTLVHQAVGTVTGGNIARFARDIVVRDERTVRGWLDGGPVPAVVVRRLRALVSALVTSPPVE